MSWIDNIAYKLDWLSIFRSPFKAPKPIFYMGKVSRGLPYFLPTGWFSFKILPLGWKDKFNCYDEKTKVLTEGGWKYFRDLTYADKLACLSDNGQVEYHIPLKLIKKPYSGKMYKLESQSVNLMVTPNHKLYVARGNLAGRYKNNIKKFKFELCTPDKYFRKSKRFLKSFLWKGEEIDEIIIPGYSYTKKGNKEGVINHYTIDDQYFDADWFLKFLGFFVAEGCADEKKGTIDISCCNDGSLKASVEQREFEEVLINLGFDIRKANEERTSIGYRIYNKALSKWLVVNCGKLAQNKKTPDFIKKLSSRQINIYLEWLYKGDGHKAETSHKLATVSKTLCEDVEQLILKGGKSFSTSIIKKEVLNRVDRIIGDKIINSNYDLYVINWLQNKSEVNIENKTIKGAKNYIEDWVHYEGDVYCATVPHNKLFVKRAGKGVWCGNSPRHEWDPVISIVLFRLQFTVTFHIEHHQWESFLTYDKYTDKNLPTIARLEESRELNPNVWLRYTEEGEVREDWFLRSLKKRWYKKFI